jgi:mono/diheme cytochrome c family protein
MRKLSGGLVLLITLVSFQSAPSKKAGVHKPAATASRTPTAGNAMSRGKIIYTKRCLACHQVDGGGVPHLNAPLDGATAVKANDKAKLIGYVLKGFNERVEIDGEYYGNNMAPLPDLSDQEIADVLTFVRNSWTNKATAVSATEVKTVRAKTKKR